jgi:hypothetical protein
MTTPMLGWKACQEPHNAPHATGIQYRDPLEAVLYTAIGTVFLAVTAINVGWF